MKKTPLTFLLIFAIIFTTLIFNSVLGTHGQTGFESSIRQAVDNSTDIASQRINKNAAVLQSMFLPTAAKGIIQNEQYSDMISCLCFLSEYELSDEQLKMFTELIRNGEKPGLVISVFKFYLTTNEDINIVKSIINCKYDFTGEHWIENAFNSLTKNKCGVIETTEELNEYLSKGLSSNDIRTANILCRKGVKTIHEILEMKLNGETWDKINEKINNTSSNIKRNSAVNIDTEISDILNLDKYIASADTTNISTEEITNRISYAKSEIKNFIYENAVKVLKSKNAIPDNFDIHSDFEQYESKAEENGFVHQQIFELSDRGFSYKEIAEISLIAKSNNCNHIDAAKIFEGGIN